MKYDLNPLPLIIKAAYSKWMAAMLGLAIIKTDINSPRDILKWSRNRSYYVNKLKIRILQAFCSAERIVEPIG